MVAPAIPAGSGRVALAATDGPLRWLHEHRYNCYAALESRLPRLRERIAGEVMVTGEKVGPLYLAPGVRKFNFWTFMYASFICIAMLAGMNFLQAYILDVNLSMPKSEQGVATGLLALVTELVAIALIVPCGALSDRIGRRPVVIVGILMCGVGYGLFPLASSLNELLVYRGIFAIGGLSLSRLRDVVAALGLLAFATIRTWTR